MKLVSKMLALVVALGFVSAVSAKDAAKGDKAGSGVKGLVTKVSGDKITVKSGHGDAAKEVEISTDANTKVTIDGKEGKVADIKEGHHVSVTPSSGTALTIEAHSGSPSKKGGDKGAGDKAAGGDKPKDSAK